MTPNCTRNNIISSKNAHSDNSAVSLNIEILTFKFSKFVT